MQPPGVAKQLKYLPRNSPVTAFLLLEAGQLRASPDVELASEQPVHVIEEGPREMGGRHTAKVMRRTQPSSYFPRYTSRLPGTKSNRAQIGR